jgi:transposase-like protein
LWAWREHRVVIIVRDEELAQRTLTAGTLGCPHAGCGGVVYRDGRARARRVRTREGGERELCPQRVACRRCGRVNVVLPAWCVPGRCDDAETIGAALVAAARGRGHRSIAKRLGRPATTVRGWLRAARAHAEDLRAGAHLRQDQIERETEQLRPAGSLLGDAVTALAAAAAAARRFFGGGRCATSLWEFIVLISGGRLLRPQRRVGS